MKSVLNRSGNATEPQSYLSQLRIKTPAADIFLPQLFAENWFESYFSWTKRVRLVLRNYLRKT